MPTDYTFTGQYSYASDFGLMFYNARWLRSVPVTQWRGYDPSLGRFAQADTIVPEQTQGVQAWDRYAFVNNNPVRYTDPSGHCIFGGIDTLMCAGALVGTVLYTANVIRSGQEWSLKDATLAAGVGATAGLLIAGAAAAVAAGAVSATVGAVVAGAGTGLATGGGGYLAANIITGNDFNATDFGIASTVGAATGAAGPLVGTTMTGARILNGVGGVVQYEATYYAHNGEFDTSVNPLIAGAISGGTTISPYTNPNSLWDDFRPMPSDSGAAWRRLQGYDPVYYPNSPAANSIAGANIITTTFGQQLVPGLAGGALSNWASGYIPE
ncbi:MAG: RHS repeat-associated core domain-containing protein [Chloroflexota bacterium]